MDSCTKTYYQCDNGFVLPKPIYQKTVKTVQAYTHYKSIANSLSNKSETVMDIEKDVTNMTYAQKYVDIIDNALNDYVPAEYREAIFAHAAYRVKYKDIEIIYTISISTAKRWCQRFIYGVATYIGDNFEE